MSAVLLDGRGLAGTLRASARARASALFALRGRPPGIGVLLVSDDPAVVAYARGKAKAAAAVGIAHIAVRLPVDSDTSTVLAALVALQADPKVDGVIVELPLPPNVDATRVLAVIDPAKDADGAHPVSLGRLAFGLPGPRPATPAAVVALLEAAGTQLAGAQAVVVGRSRTVGLPAALMLLARDATVSICHSRTRDMAALARTADVLVVAAGVPELIGPEAVKPGATVVDVGTNWLPEPRADDPSAGRLVGDVAFDAVRAVAGRLTPVPGGVGPVTTATLLLSVVALAEANAASSNAGAPHR